MGVDDGRLVLIAGAPWLVYAAVAPKGHSSYCCHKMMLCPLKVPVGKEGQVRCQRTIPVRFDGADNISEQHRKAGRLANVHQKNWAPFVHWGELYLVFTIEPLVVLRVDLETGACSEVSDTRTPAMGVFYAADRTTARQHSTMGVHGGSPLIQLPAAQGGEYLGIGRIARGNIQYALFLYTIAANSLAKGSAFEMSRVSPIFCFASTSPHHSGLCETIQFAGGLVIVGGKDDARGSLIVTYGTNDCEAKVAFLPLSHIYGMLRPAAGSAHKGRT